MHLSGLYLPAFYVNTQNTFTIGNNRYLVNGDISYLVHRDIFNPS